MSTDVKKTYQIKNSTKHTNIIDKSKTSNHRPYSNSKQLSTSNLSNNHQANYEHQDHNNSDDLYKIRLYSNLVARKNPFADLMKIALSLNPREFELPEDYVPNIQFPGTSKKQMQNTTTREGRYTSYSVKRAQELDRNNLPLILRTCYVCRRGCRKAPLIHCDYCPLVYHADCVDPPLTILPNTRWMCPNHVEPIAEEKLLTSSSFCERVKLWNHFSKPIDHERIKISFLDKVHESPAPCREETDRVTKLGCRVPTNVKNDYERYMRDIDRYQSESDDDAMHVDTQKESSLPAPSDRMANEDPAVCSSTSILSSTASSSDQTNHQQLLREHESLIDIALRYMIESSKLLESEEYIQHQQPQIGDKNPLN